MPKCPICGSSDNERTNWGTQTFQTIASVGLGLFFGSKSPIGGPEHSKYKCHRCGHEWQVD